MSALLSPSRRVRRTPFSDGVEAAGVKAYTVYNHMLLPTLFRSVEEDCAHLKSAVQVWDVACERQIELRGPDAGRLMQMLTPRDLRGMMPGQCRYVPMVDETGGMLNDPVALKLAEDRYWISIADSDLLLWVKGLAWGMRLDVLIDEPDVHPLGVQGPLAEDLMVRVFGDAVRAVRFFRFGWFDFQGTSVAVARSGYSKQGGVEIYCPGPQAAALWDALFEAGRDLDVRAGCPNLIERIEGGLLSYGNDITAEDTPFEAGLGRYCDGAHDHVGRAALALRREPGRIIRPVAIEADALPACDAPWPVEADGRRVGQVTSAAHSRAAGCGVAIGMIDVDAGADASVRLPDGRSLPASIRREFWI